MSRPSTQPRPARRPPLARGEVQTALRGGRLSAIRPGPPTRLRRQGTFPQARTACTGVGQDYRKACRASASSPEPSLITGQMRDPGVRRLHPGLVRARMQQLDCLAVRHGPLLPPALAFIRQRVIRDRLIRRQEADVVSAAKGALTPAADSNSGFSLKVTDLEGLVEKLREHGAHFRNDIVAGVSGKQILLDDPPAIRSNCSSQRLSRRGSRRLARNGTSAASPDLPGRQAVKPRADVKLVTPIQAQDQGVVSLVEKHPSNPAPGQSKGGGNRRHSGPRRRGQSWPVRTEVPQRCICHQLC